MYCKELQSFLKKLCINNEGVIAEAITEAGKDISYVETINPHISDGLHWNVKRNYVEILSVEYFRYVTHLLKKMHLGSVTLVADVTTENFYGDHAGLFLHGWTGERGVKAKFHFLVVAILFRNKIIPVYVAIIPLGAYIAEYLGQALEWIKTLNVNISSVLLDRGFYSGDVIRTFQVERSKYLIFVPKNRWIKKMLAEHPQDCILEHEIKYSKNKTKNRVETDHVFFHEKEDYVWIFATNLHFSDLKKYVSLYKKRWNIETMFRVHDEGRIKTKSIIPQIRLFYFLISMLFVLFWNLKWKEKMSFKHYLLLLHQEVEEMLSQHLI